MCVDLVFLKYLTRDEGRDEDGRGGGGAYVGGQFDF